MVLARDEGMADVGCSAGVSSVTRRYDDGRMDIVVTGEKRYRLLRYESGRAPYLIGELEYFGEPHEEVNRQLAASTVELFNELLLKAYKGEVDAVGPGRCETGLSFVLAQKAGMDLSRRQELLEIPGENGRLRMLNAYLVELLPRLKRMEDLEKVINNDGYL